MHTQLMHAHRSNLHSCMPYRLKRTPASLSYNSSVNPTTLSRLLELNRQFYQDFAAPFAATRQRLQPGVKRVLDELGAVKTILDIGCGSGELGRELGRRGFRGDYTGLDFSNALLEQASAGQPGNFHYLQADLACQDWAAPLAGSRFEVITLFAVLHHLPGEELRRGILRQLKALLQPGGRLIHSEWQFLNSPRLASRLQPWELAGLSAGDVDPGDHLLDWRQGGRGLRYVHHFSEAELADLAATAGFEIIETFHSDGESGRLGLYQVWR